MKKKELISYLILISCATLQSCFDFGRYSAPEYFALEHTAKFSKQDRFITQNSKWFTVNSKYTDFTGNYDSLDIFENNIKAYRNGETVINEPVVRDVDYYTGYNTDRLAYFSNKDSTHYYYQVNYLDSLNLVLSIDNYKNPWKHPAWFHFSKVKSKFSDTSVK